MKRASIVRYIAGSVLRVYPAIETESSIGTSSVDDFCRKVDIDDAGESVE